MKHAAVEPTGQKGCVCGWTPPLGSVALRALDRHLLDERLDDKVEEWHEGAGEGMALHEYLGMTQEQYAAWVKNPRSADAQEA